MTIPLIALGVIIAALVALAVVLVPAVRDMKSAAAASREAVERMRRGWEPVAEEKKRILESVARLQTALAGRERASAALSEIVAAKEKLRVLTRFFRTALALKRTVSGGGATSLALELAETLLTKRRNNE